MDGNKFSWTSWGDILNPENDTETWANYEGDFYAGIASVTFNRIGKGSVTYVGTDSNYGDLEYAVLKKLYSEINIDIENFPEGIIVEYRDGFGIALNYSDQNYSINISENASILVGNKVLPPAGVCVWKIE